MTSSSGFDTGVIAISEAAGATAPDIVDIARRLTSAEVSRFVDGSASVSAWGVDESRSGGTSIWPLSRGLRGPRGDVAVEHLADLVQHRRSSIGDLMPPFAALTLADQSVTAAVDAMGARHLYATQDSGWAALSTHPQALAQARRTTVDAEAVAIQLMLGWQLDARTMYTGVRKVAAGCATSGHQGVLTDTPYGPSQEPPSVDMDRAVRSAAALLRDYMGDYLDDHPDATLQLTGGQDSRILLSAIPQERRLGLRAMTLSVPGSDDDVRIAQDFATRFGMHHIVLTLDGLDEWSPEEAHERVVASSRQLGCMADPIALAVLRFAESKIDQGPRISGLGGEVARGFYYLFPSIRVPVSRRTVAMLANWRMFANESVSQDALVDEFHDWAAGFAHAEVYRLFAENGDDIRAASDVFYLEQRMQRWAGVTDSAVCFDRDVVNPMLDRRFLDIARGLSVSDKANSKFLGRLQVTLDEDLADVALDGRSTPRSYAHRTVPSTFAQGRSFTRRSVRKLRQRINADHKPPAGGDEVAAKVVEHWRAHPDVLSGLSTSSVVDGAWIDRVCSGAVQPDAATVAFMVNLFVAERECQLTN